MKHILLVGIITISSMGMASAQKVKYKELFVLLKAENFKDADPFLRNFLVTKPDHPNANYHMGKMLQTYMQESNLVSDSVRIVELADSAVYYFNKSLALCTEKYVEKQHDDDFYADYRRRNMRTGKFEVKLSDVQFEMEERKESIAKFKEDDSKLIKHFREAEKFNRDLNTTYRSLTEDAATLNILYFTAGADQLNSLREIKKQYDSIIYHFNTYRVLKKDMSSKADVQKLDEVPVTEYPLNVDNNIDFTAPTVEIRNLKAWATQVHDKIGKQIFPLKARMIDYDKELAEVHDQIVKDSLDGRSEIFALATKNVGRDIREYNPSSLPAAIYNFRIAEINYHSTVNVWHLEVEDTLNVDVKFNVLADIEKQISAVSRLVIRLVESNTPQERIMFRDFIKERYTDENGLYNFIQEQVSFVHNDSIQLLDWISKTKVQDTRTIWHSDSIPLLEGSQILNLDSTNYATFRIDSLDNRNVSFYSWQASNDSLALAFGVAPSSRVLDSLYTVDLGLPIDAQTSLATTYLTDSLNDDNLVWVLPIKQEEDSVSLKILSTSVRRGLSWEQEVVLGERLDDVKYDRENQKIMFYGNEQKILLVLNENGEEQEIAAEEEESK